MRARESFSYHGIEVRKQHGLVASASATDRPTADGEIGSRSVMHIDRRRDLSD